MSEPAADTTSSQDPVAAAVARLRGLLGRGRETGGLSPGDLAALRHAGRTLPPVLWRLLTLPETEAAITALSHRDREPGHRDREPAERAFAIVIQAMVEAPNAGATTVGKALAQTGYAEQRFVRLLRARGPDEVGDAARQVARWCAAHGAGLTFADRYRNDGFAGFILHAALSHAAPAERRAHAIARDYFATQPGEAAAAAAEDGDTAP